MYSYAVSPLESPKGVGCLGASPSAPVYHLTPLQEHDALRAAVGGAMPFRDAAATHKVDRVEVL